MALSLNLTLDQGTTLVQQFVYTNATSPDDLTACSAFMQIRSDASLRGTLYETFSSALGSIVLGGSSGTITFSMLASATSSATTWQFGYYDLKLVMPDGVTVKDVANGTITINLSPTSVS